MITRQDQSIFTGSEQRNRFVANRSIFVRIFNLRGNKANQHLMSNKLYIYKTWAH